MTIEESWRFALESSTNSGFHVYALDAAPTEADWANLADAEPPGPVRAFAELWTRGNLDPWRVLVESAATVNPDIGDKVSDSSVLTPLRSMMARVERAALMFGHPSHWTSPNQWGYLLHVRHSRQEIHESVILHPPAGSAELARTEHVLALKLPPSFERFLLLTNGLGLGKRGTHLDMWRRPTARQLERRDAQSLDGMWWTT